jgi:small Trp-rich protein
MVFVLIGVLLLVLKLLEVGAVAAWAWWWVLSPFGVALAWWAWSDASGLTRKREMMRDEERKEARRKRNVENMGMSPTQRRR